MSNSCKTEHFSVLLENETLENENIFFSGKFRDFWFYKNLKTRTKPERVLIETIVSGESLYIKLGRFMPKSDQV